MEIPRHWRLKKQRYMLVGEVCPHCGAKIFPPRGKAPCPYCGSTSSGEEVRDRKGVVVYNAEGGDNGLK